MFRRNIKLIFYKTINLYALHVLLSEIYYNSVNLNTGTLITEWQIMYL